ncbi:hypothetical protein WR25_00127 [Diploscapter pachys]|uniref:GRAM domain-containing protein n=1 Tax=Diploscapter pachys TaxID=2018661 RepID=A0A2A2KSS9_9BILA|nr:hypothetical protein WR25_00127 [Diploscapter pachys]
MDTSSIIDVMRKNYDIVSALADINTEDQPRNNQRRRASLGLGQIMRGRHPNTRPIMLRDHNPYNKYGNVDAESASITSSESNISDYEPETRSERWRHDVRQFLNDLVNALENPRDERKVSTVFDRKLSVVVLRRDLSRCYTALQPIFEILAALYDLILWKNPMMTLLLALGLLGFAADILEKLESLLTWRNVTVSTHFCYLLVYWLAWSALFNTGTCLGACALAFGVRLFVTTYLFDRFPKLRVKLGTYEYFYRNLPLAGEQIHKFVSSSSSSGRQASESLTSMDSVRKERPSSFPTSNNQRSMSITRNSAPVVDGEVFESRLGANFNLNPESTITLLMHNMNRENTHKLSTTSHPNLPQNASTSNFSERRTSVQMTSDICSSSPDEDDLLEEKPVFEENPILEHIVAFRSCVMNEKEKIFPKGITAGTLYLTDSALIFRSKNTNDRTEEIILFTDVKNVKKIQSLRSLSVLTGTRKSIEIMIAERRKPLQFVGLAKRDEFVTRLEVMIRQAGAEHVNFY